MLSSVKEELVKEKYHAFVNLFYHFFMNRAFLMNKVFLID